MPRAVVLAVAILVALSPQADAQFRRGMMGSATAITLRPHQAPALLLPAGAIALEVRNETGAPSRLVATLHRALGRQLTDNDARLRLADDAAVILTATAIAEMKFDERNSGGVAFITAAMLNFIATATENADTRNWTSLLSNGWGRSPFPLSTPRSRSSKQRGNATRESTCGRGPPSSCRSRTAPTTPRWRSSSFTSWLRRSKGSVRWPVWPDPAGSSQRVSGTTPAVGAR